MSDRTGPAAEPPSTEAEDAPKPSAGRLRAPRNRNDDAEAYLIELGQRVRSMRAVRGMSRKVLAKASGVSERYIAQLESGQGNVSIMLLRRVAEATGAPLEDLVAEPARLPQDWTLIRDLLRKAPPATVQDVKALLSGAAVERPAAELRVAVDRVALIGLRGAGKSTLGRMAAEKLGWRFVELNREIEIESGFSVSEVFSLYGQDGYRRYEGSALARIAATPGPMVLATGGGIVAEPVTFERLLSNFFTVWVQASPAEHMSRVRKQGDLRPMGADKAAMSELITILRSREPFYGRARAAIDTTNATLDESLAALLAAIQSYCVSGCPWQSRNRA